MQEVALTNETKKSVYRFVYGITFFKEIIDSQPEQFELLMARSHIIEAKPNEIIINKGEPGSYLYFLLKGQLLVLPYDGASDDQAVNEINPGALFGTMAMVTEQRRSATIKVDNGSKSTLLFAIDFNLFRDITDFTVFTIDTKISFYRLIVNNIRWTLETNKMKEPNHPLVAQIRKLTLFRGERGSQEELKSLKSQAQELSNILKEWNTF